MIEQSEDELIEMIIRNPRKFARLFKEQSKILDAVDKAVAKAEKNGKKSVH